MVLVLPNRVGREAVPKQIIRPLRMSFQTCFKCGHPPSWNLKNVHTLSYERIGSVSMHVRAILNESFELALPYFLSAQSYRHSQS
jgi:hypothetical protein